MISLGISLTTISPMLLSAGPPAHNLIETKDFIPGNSVRGMLAQRYLSLGGQPQAEEFRRIFLLGEVRFGFAYINGAQKLPLSVRSCKYHGGFRKDGGHGILDLLLAEGGEKRCLNSECGQSIDYTDGFWNPIENRKETIRKRLITRTAIDPVRGTASSAHLYSQRVIEEGQNFRGIIDVPADLVNALKKLLAKPFTAGIGTGRSRGQGWITVSSPEPLVFPPMQSVRERFERFCQRAGSVVLAVTLLSDAIFQDDYLRDCTAPSPVHLEPLSIRPEEWVDRADTAFASQRAVFGFDGEPLRLPRASRTAVVGGSTFLFKARDGVAPSIPDGDGMGWIGENNAEGYGQVVLWHPFHLEQKEEGDS